MIAEDCRGHVTESLRDHGRTRVRAAVLGSPVGHSLSPVLHGTAYAELGLTWWRYEAIECDEASLPGFLDSCGPDWAGLSLTMPLKRAVLPLLDRREPLVTEVGGANTVLFAADQRLGYNTDVPGMIRALAEHGVGGSQIAGPVVILGGGATACAALAAVRDLGERTVTVALREPSRVGQLRDAADRIGARVETERLGPQVLDGAALVISTIPAGAADSLAVALGTLARPPAVVFDVVYHPWPTALAGAAGRAGAVVVGGFDLLLHQAALQVELLTGRSAPLAAMRAAGLAALRARRESPGGRDALRLREEHRSGHDAGPEAEDHLGRLPPGRCSRLRAAR